MGIKHGIFLAGHGGQGILFAGKLLAYAAGIIEGRQVLWLPSYGASVRGGTANCSVIISEDRIRAPVLEQPDSLVFFNQESADRFAGLVGPESAVLWDSASVTRAPWNGSPRGRAVPLDHLAKTFENRMVANVIMLGALIALHPVVSAGAVATALGETMKGKKEKVLAENLRALEIGQQWAQAKEG